eukprot:TRINITY_DN4764_c0_g1_i1.p1 TRINITY_DN4764_c0_g1~~TRINITY_DN4764_c0_g1_i1.p1  ORF type:complete len:1204 (-),score=346.33 TRINITY_DN4764_c0_g1_i1:50-3661(-)
MAQAGSVSNVPRLPPVPPKKVLPPPPNASSSQSTIQPSTSSQVIQEPAQKPPSKNVSPLPSLPPLRSAASDSQTTPPSKVSVPSTPARSQSQGALSSSPNASPQVLRATQSPGSKRVLPTTPPSKSATFRLTSPPPSNESARLDPLPSKQAPNVPPKPHVPPKPSKLSSSSSAIVTADAETRTNRSQSAFEGTGVSKLSASEPSKSSSMLDTRTGSEQRVMSPRATTNIARIPSSPSLMEEPKEQNSPKAKPKPPSPLPPQRSLSPPPSPSTQTKTPPDRMAPVKVMVLPVAPAKRVPENPPHKEPAPAPALQRPPTENEAPAGRTLSTTLCSKCMKAFELNEPKISAKSKLYHKHCFVCNTCHLPFVESFATVEGNPYHVKCLCAKCKKPFVPSEQKMNAQGLLWHKSCFVCTHCSNPFTTTFTTKNNKVYHVECWVEASEKIKAEQEAKVAAGRERSDSKYDYMRESFRKPDGFFKKLLDDEKKQQPSGDIKKSTEEKYISKDEERRLRKEEQKRKDQLKKEEQKRKHEQKKEEKLKKQAQKMKERQAKKKDKLLQTKKVGAYNGILARALIDQIASVDDEKSIDSILSFRADDLFHITDTRQALEVANTTATLRVGGGSGIMIGYHNGRQGFVPTHFIELIEASRDEDFAVTAQKLLKLLVAPDMLIALGLCAVAPREELSLISKAFVNLFESNGNILEFIHMNIQNEIAQTTDPSTLFRNNSMASAVMTGYFFSVGKEYLIKVLSPLIQDLLQYPYSVEVDPGKQKDGDVSQNAPHLIEVSQRFFDAIVGSIDLCPRPIKNICHMLATEVTNKFPSAKHIVIGGFFFLRAFTPAVVSPENFSIVDELDPKLRRPLVLISKLLQNVSNDREFKEEYMQPINSFIATNNEAAKRFFDDLGQQYFEGATRPTGVPLIESIDHDNLLKMHQQLSIHLSKIGKEVEMMSDFVPLDYSPFESLLPIMNELGPPSQNLPKSAAPAETLRKPVNRDVAPSRERIPKIATEEKHPEQEIFAEKRPPAENFASPVGHVDFEELKLDPTTQVPLVILELLRDLEERGTKQEYLLKQSGNVNEVADLRTEIEKGLVPAFSKCDVRSVAVILRDNFLKDILEPLNRISSSVQVEGLLNEMSRLPLRYFNTLDKLFGFLNKIALSPEGKMDSTSLAEMLASHTDVSTFILALFIDEHDQIFQQENSDLRPSRN